METIRHFTPGIISLCLILISIPLFRYLIKQGMKEAKGVLSPNVRLRKFKEIISYPDWYNANYEMIEDTHNVVGKGYTLDEFALGLFTGNPEVLNRLKII